MSGNASPHTSRLAALNDSARFGPMTSRAGRLDKREHEVVARARRMNASWGACANMVGKSEHAVRLACDPDYTPVHASARPLVPVKASQEAATGAFIRGLGIKGREAACLAALWRASKPLSVVQLLSSADVTASSDVHATWTTLRGKLVRCGIELESIVSVGVRLAPAMRPRLDEIVAEFANG